MQVNLFKDRIQIQQKTVTQTATGQTVIWKPIQTKYGRKIPLDTKTRIQYQQLKSEVSHKMIFKDGVTLDLGTYRFYHGGNTYEPIDPPVSLANNTVILVKES